MSESVKEIFKFGNRGIPTDADQPYYKICDADYENLKKIRPVDTNFDGAYGNPGGTNALKWGQPLKPEYFPKRIQKRDIKDLLQISIICSECF